MVRQAPIDPAADTTARIQEWRHAAKRVARAWNAWLAAERSERARAFAAYVEALGAEELAASRIAETA